MDRAGDQILVSALASSCDKPLSSLQVPFGHIFPLTFVHVHLGLARTRVGAGDVGAVLLARLGNSKTILLGLGGSRKRHKSQGHQGSGGSDHPGTLVHVEYANGLTNCYSTSQPDAAAQRTDQPLMA